MLYIYARPFMTMFFYKESTIKPKGSYGPFELKKLKY
jgi:hypothetical protein